MCKLDKVTVTFTHVSGESITLDLVSKFTCIIGDNSGEGKTEFFTMLTERDEYEDIIIKSEIPVSTIITRDAMNNTINSPERQIIITDETSMRKWNMLDKINRSPHLFICITRSMEVHFSYPYCSIYKLHRTKNWFNIILDNSLQIGNLLDEYDYIITESSKDRSEHELLSVYLNNLVPASGRDRVAKTLRNLEGNILVLIDLGNIGPAYSRLVVINRNRPNVHFYNYQCFEELLYRSSLVQKLNNPNTVSNLNYLTIEQYYEKLLHDRTGDTVLHYEHKKPLAKEFLEVENFKDVFDSDVGRDLMDYIIKNTEIELDSVNTGNMNLF